MPRTFLSKEKCNISAADFWALRIEEDFDCSIAKKDGQNFDLQWVEVSKDQEGNDVVERSVRSKFFKNPVPSSLRRFLKDPDFAVSVQSKWWVHHYDEAHAMEYQLQLPVFSDKIKVAGKQWAEPLSENSCMLCAKVQISVTKMGVLTPTIEKQTAANIEGAYKLLPERVLEYVASPEHKAYATTDKPKLTDRKNLRKPTSQPPTTVTEDLETTLDDYELPPSAAAEEAVEESLEDHMTSANAPSASAATPTEAEAPPPPPPQPPLPPAAPPPPKPLALSAEPPGSTPAPSSIPMSVATLSPPAAATAATLATTAAPSAAAEEVARLADSAVAAAVVVAPALPLVSSPLASSAATTNAKDTVTHQGSLEVNSGSTQALRQRAQA
eukprot:CAMPEP_0174752318 /NCGR_PEP_ID=MMETSP1094-20130205/101782_1 /TAXON_ID=156173 /ORGANISM="Chrysochromulina brevifilum, Strain UTEX LB 985" /LENGTH=383 /DNA_ID=CAMNT_0015957945 /DNA_START=91 /DNA_END=1238 /DNA_ORIENTATION=+